MIFTATLYYASRRPDLDESLVMDCLQGVVYKNDRQIKVKHIYWGLDKANPRCEIIIEPLQKELGLNEAKISDPKAKGPIDF